MAKEDPPVGGAWGVLLGNLGSAAQGPTAQVYREWERWFGQQFERLAGTEQFGQHLGRALALTGALKPWIDQAVGAALSARRAGEDGRVAALEARITALEATVRDLQARP